MAIYEMAHPLGQEIELVYGAISAGMLTSPDVRLPESLMVTVTDPFAHEDGVVAITVTDLEYENRSEIIIPIAPKIEDTSWEVCFDDGDTPVRQRVFVQDMYGERFPVTVGDAVFESPFLRFDITDEGIIFSAKDDEERRLSYGEYEGELYDAFSRFARELSCLHKLVTLARAY
jgi:hypothetical protein